MSFVPFLHETKSRYLHNLCVFLCWVNIVTYFPFTQGTSYKFDKSFFKIIVMKCILEIGRSLLLRPSYLIYSLLVFIFVPFISLIVFNRWQDCLIKYQIYTTSITYFLKINFASKRNFSGNNLRSCRKHVPSITRVSILKRSSDITRVSSSFSSERLGFFYIDLSMSARQRGTCAKGRFFFHFSISPISIFRNKSRSIFTSTILFLLVNLKLALSLLITIYHLSQSLSGCVDCLF